MSQHLSFPHQNEQKERNVLVDFADVFQAHGIQTDPSKNPRLKGKADGEIKKDALDELTRQLDKKYADLDLIEELRQARDGVIN
jgi:hypothetical protein